MAIPAAHCATCGADLVDDPPGRPRTPCPECGSTTRILDDGITLAAKAGMKFRVKGRHAGGGRPYFEAVTGDDRHRDTGRWVERAYTVDRETDLYHERVVDPKTGEVIHECSEPLTKHQGHGSARKKV